MTREEKVIVVDEIAERLSSTNYFYLTDASGLSVLDVNNLRRKCFEGGIGFKVYKNTLIKKAFDKLDADYSALEDLLKGATGVMFSPESGNAPAKMIKDFRKKDGKKPVLKGAYIDSDVFVGDDQLGTLADLKSKNELIGEIIGLLQSPAKNVISALQSSGSKLSGIVKTLSEREEK